MFFRPLPILQPTTNVKSVATEDSIKLPWPTYGQAAIGASGFGVLATNSEQKAAPVASVAKVVTALSILNKKPLAVGEQGPILVISSADVAAYNDYYSKGGSVAKVVAGERISQYQALQGMLIPSANNFADTLAVWAFGTLDKYIISANSYAKSIGLSNTHIADASGFSPQTLSTARDLVLLGEKALENPVIASIVSQQQATIPEAGLIKNTNWLLGEGGVIGIKTGNTGEAGGCYLFAAKKKVEKNDVTIIGAILGSPDRNRVISDSRSLIDSSVNGFKTVTPVKAGEIVGNYSAPWGSSSPAVAKDSLQLFTWKGQPIKVIAKLEPSKSPAAQGKVVGQIAVKVGEKTTTTQAVLKKEIANPSWKWRIFER